MADFCRVLEVAPKGDNYRIVKNIIIENQLTPNFKGTEKYRAKTQGTKKDLSEILESGNYINATKLKERLFN